ncbi:MAG: ABC transporter permease [Methanosarcinaceae archaeon]
MYEFQIARRHITSKQRHTLFSVLSVALAIGMIVSLMSMMSGFSEELIQMTVENSAHIVVNSPNDDGSGDIHLYQHYTSQIAAMEGVIAVSPRILAQAAISYRDNSAGVLLNGVDPPFENAVMQVTDDVVAGSFIDLSRTDRGIVLGDKLAEELEVDVADRVDIVSPGKKAMSLRVIGIIDTGTGLDETLAYARLGTVQDFYDKEGVVSSIAVRTNDPYQANTIATTIRQQTGLDVMSWTEANSEILGLLNTQTLFVWIYYALIYAMAGFGIVNMLITIVMEKKSEIGMLMAMGTSKRSITLIFLIESTILGTMGLVVGCILGYLVSVGLGMYQIDLPADMYFGITTMPMKIEIMNFVYAAGFAFVLNVIAGVYPARRAANLDPVEAIESV